jgi:hypothetical protein
MARLIFRNAQSDTTATPTNLAEALTAIENLQARYNELVLAYNGMANYLNGLSI